MISGISQFFLMISGMWSRTSLLKVFIVGELVFNVLYPSKIGFPKKLEETKTV